jgi:hypothetical protein
MSACRLSDSRLDDVDSRLDGPPLSTLLGFRVAYRGCVAGPRCCGYSKVLNLKSRGLLILLKLTLVSDEGVYLIVARRKAICYGRTFTVNVRAFTFVTWWTV